MDASAFTSLYEDTATPLYAWAVLRCRGPLGRALSPDDLVQEVCLQAFSSLESYDEDRGPFRPWFFGVANRVASNALRRLARGRLLPGAPLSASHAGRLPGSLTTISRRVRRDEALERFLEDLDGLPAEDRSLLIYRGLEGLEHEEVGRLLGLSAEVAAKRWQRLRDRLREWPSSQSLFEES